MKVSQTYGGDLMSAKDISQGEFVVATIANVGSFNDKEKGVRFRLQFSDYDKDLVLNKTNAGFLQENLGDDTDDWEGAKIKIVAAPVTFMGKETMGLSIKGAKPASAESKPAKKQNQSVNIDGDDIPF